MVKDQLAKKLIKTSRVDSVHLGFRCVVCGMEPLTGIRYHCSQRMVDYCENCEAKAEAPFPLVQIRNPEQLPSNMMLSFVERPSLKIDDKPILEILPPAQGEVLAQSDYYQEQ